jgi:hypothetical protein
MRLAVCAVVGAMALTAGAAALAQDSSPIAYVPTAGVTVSGSLEVENGRASIANNGTITAGEHMAVVKLARGGELKVCGTTKVQLSRDTSVPAADAGLMIALARGALEASYTPGKYSDVLLTPDLRILISGPGTADLKIRVNEKGDTCVDNHGADAPYVTVTSQFAGGLYRVQADQRVMFEGGSLQKVVDNETEPCGCPVEAAPPMVMASAAAAPKKSAAVTKAEAANPFPLAQSEGLTPPEPAPTEPVVPVGQVHAEVQAPIPYDAGKTPNPEAPGAAGKEPVSESTADTLTATQASSTAAQATPATTEPGTKAQKKQGGFFHSIGHFFARIFGR